MCVTFKKKKKAINIYDEFLFLNYASHLWKLATETLLKLTALLKPNIIRPSSSLPLALMGL